MADEKKKKYLQCFKTSYSQQFDCIIKSRKGENYAFCTECDVDINIGHAGSGDILNHIGRKKHKDNLKNARTTMKIDSFCANQSNTSAVINAECLFTAFIVEHNLPVSCADHVGPLLRKIIPNNDITKNYGCARTKTTAIIGEFASTGHKHLVDILRVQPFSIATDGSSDTNKKLYPIVVTYFCPESGQIENRLLSAPVLIGDATGRNIGNMLLETFKKLKIPIKNCICLGADNAPVMIGRKKGVAAVLQEMQENIIIMGCPCHLLHLTAEKGSSCLPIKVDELLVDIFFYLEKSSKRKDKLKAFQALYDTDVKKILKHASTRWLSTTKCLERLISEWEPLVSFFKEEIPSKNTMALNLKNKIPKKPSTDVKVIEKQGESSSKKHSTSQVSVCNKNKKIKVDTAKQYKNELSVLCHQERLFYILSSEINKAYCLFLLSINPCFDKINVMLQSQAPLIHRLRSLLLQLFLEIISKFVKPGVVKENADILKVQYCIKQNQKIDDDILIGHSTKSIVINLKPEDKTAFYFNVRNYFVTCCDYMLQKFPLRSEVLVHAEVCNVQKIDVSSFSSIQFFTEKFSVVLDKFANEDVMDEIQSEFCKLQITPIEPTILLEQRADTQWHLISKLKDEFGNKPFAKISHVMLSILSITHSNAECERVFSQVKKLKTQFRSTMSDSGLENLLITKCSQKGKCFEQQFDKPFLKKAKSAASQNKCDE